MVRPQAQANACRYIPTVNEGRIEFGIATVPGAAFAVRGIEMSSDSPAPNLRMVATLIPFHAGLMSPGSAGIADIAGLKGEKAPKFPDGAPGDRVIKAALSTAGLACDDVTAGAAANFPAMFQGVKDGTLDVAIAAFGSQITHDVESAQGGVVFLTLKPEDWPTQAEILPGASVKVWPAGEDLPGIHEGVASFTCPCRLFAGKDVDDAAVTEAVKALHEGEAALKARGAL